MIHIKREPLWDRVFVARAGCLPIAHTHIRIRKKPSGRLHASAVDAAGEE
jgi:hypothetical protein